MRSEGWYSRPNVTILEGQWQDYLNLDGQHSKQQEQLSAFGGFDAVYTDTFSEDYASLKLFFEHLPDLMDGPEARFSFFNGLGATSKFPVTRLYFLAECYPRPPFLRRIYKYR
jgi:type IV protein arginine methyltransferase